MLGESLVVGVPVVTYVKRVTGKGSDRRTALVTLDPEMLRDAQVHSSPRNRYYIIVHSIK